MPLRRIQDPPHRLRPGDPLLTQPPCRRHTGGRRYPKSAHHAQAPRADRTLGQIRLRQRALLRFSRRRAASRLGRAKAHLRHRRNRQHRLQSRAAALLPRKQDPSDLQHGSRLQIRSHTHLHRRHLHLHRRPSLQIHAPPSQTPRCQLRNPRRVLV